MKKLCVLCVLCGGFVVETVAQRAEQPAFELVQPDLFGISGGQPNAFYRNDGARFVDVAPALKMDAAGRAATSGSNGPSVADFDNDGDLDLFVAGYGPNFFYRNDGGLTFTDVAGALGVAGGERATPSRWGDFDNDGRPDLYISSYIDKAVNERDYFFRNTGAAFEDVIPPTMRKHGATHGVQWADFDGDGDLDLALANNNPEGRNSLYRNLLPADRAHRSVQVLVLDAGGRHTQAGAEVRVFASGTRKLLGMGIVDTGGGYCSQIVAPVHIGLPSDDRVDVEVTALTSKGRTIARATGVAPDKSRGRVVTVRTEAKASAHD